jgi:hypothetical protein
MTIKDCVIQALLDAFPDGDTPGQIREYIFNVSGREIFLSSLWPQMQLLKADGILEQDASIDTWNLRDDKRKFLFAIYHHATTPSAMKELKDDDGDR